MIYLLTHVQDFASYGGKVKAGAYYAKELVSNISHSAFDKTPTEEPSSQKINTDLINIIIQASEDDLGGLISAASSVSINTRKKVHFYFVVPEDSKSHLQ